MKDGSVSDVIKMVGRSLTTKDADEEGTAALSPPADALRRDVKKTTHEWIEEMERSTHSVLI